MKCDDCDFAEWDRTANGRLHPNKQGRCTRLDKHPLDLRIPAAFVWSMTRSDHDTPPTPHWGQITRGEELRRKCEFKSRTVR